MPQKKLKKHICPSPVFFRTLGPMPVNKKLRAEVLFFFFLFLAGSLCAQNRVIDSLSRLLSQVKTDSEKADVYCYIARYYSQSDDNRAILQYSASVRRLTESGCNARARGRAYNLKGLVEMHKGDSRQALEYFSSSLQFSLKAKWKPSIIAAYGNMGTIYCNTGKFSEALQTQYAALKLSEDDKDTSNIAYSYLEIGNIYSFQKNYEEANRFFHKALDLYKRIGDSRGLSDAYTSLGII